MLRLHAVPALLPVLLALACGGGGGRARGDAPAAVVQVPGVPAASFDAKSAIHGVGASRTVVLLSDAADLCAALGGGAGRCGGSDAAAFGAHFLRIDVPGRPPGTFSGPGLTAVAIAPGQVAVSSGSGTVELGAESPSGALAGSWSLGAVGSGTFTSQRCAALDAAAGAGKGTSERSCSTSVNVDDGAARFEEQCTCDGETTARACTLAAGAASWQCTCTAASGATSTCTAAAASGGVVTPPPDCCAR